MGKIPGSHRKTAESSNSRSREFGTELPDHAVFLTHTRVTDA